MKSELGVGRVARNEFINICRPRDLDRDPVIVDVNLAARHWMIVGQYPDLIRCRGIQGNHSPASHAQQLLHG